ncbi:MULTISPECIES: hypothetical protein [Cysteiniphilum]|uniref:Uncharacterized protein n=1 Tax=Cysteiniphilum litorale TaxID=2056700 RepID=A0A8J3E8C9_9GAMM|nr:MULTISPECIES: hypothetical protein [Cysteiniphilum]GGF92406.1 hypothetical protein GCM10010995_06990 [Cysteiniphilum litorale]
MNLNKDKKSTTSEATQDKRASNEPECDVHQEAHADQLVKTVEIDIHTASMLVKHVHKNLGFYPKVVITDGEDDDSSTDKDMQCTRH